MSNYWLFQSQQDLFGRKVQAGTDITFESEVWSYSRSRGLFAGISLEGARVYSEEDFSISYQE